MAQVTKPAPFFKATALMPNSSFKEVSLDEFKGKYLVLFFYPLDFTFVCPTEIIAFSDAAKKFKACNCEVVGASVDSHFTHFAWTETPRNMGGLGKMDIPLLSDLDHKVSKDYGALLDAGHTCRATFIIDNTGVLRHASFNAPGVGRNIEEILRLVKAFQFTDKHGEVCPVNWKPGDSTIKPDPVKKVEFFEKEMK